VAETPELVRRAKANDAGAFGELYERYAGFVHGILLAHVPPEDASDLLHDVFLDAWRGIASLRQGASFSSWLASIARNRTRMHWRKARSTVQLSAEIPSPDAWTPEVSDALTILRSLPETYREPLVLRFVEGLSGAEIADRLGLTHGSVRVYLHRGLAMLRERLGERA
jgi:RNA polymerase sigma-70 factor (ECF subfamily)